jgi:hypothetical protein
MIEGHSVRIRRAELDDLDFLVGLFAHAEVEPFLAAVRAKDPESVRAEIERSLAEPEEFGRFLIEAIRKRTRGASSGA